VEPIAALMTHQDVQVARQDTFEAFDAEQLEWARRLTFVLTGGSPFVDDLVQDAFVEGGGSWRS